MEAKSTASLAIILASTILHGSAVIAGGSRDAYSPINDVHKWGASNKQVAFIDALLNSLKGEAGLKATCKTVWHSSEPTTFVEKMQCDSARKEIALAKEDFPRIASKYDALKALGIPDNVNTKNAPMVVAAYIMAEDYIGLCTNKQKTAIRAAKTMDYWGTNRVGNWHYQNLWEMGAWKGREIIESCKSGSWVYAIRDKSQPLLATWWDNLLNSLGSKGTGSNRSACLVNYKSNQWSQSLLAQINRQEQEANSELETLEKVSLSSGLLSKIISDFSISTVQKRASDLRMTREACSTLYQRGVSIIAENERKEIESRRKTAAAKAEAKRRAQNAAAAAAARQREAQEKQKIMQGVKIQ
jgi:hypothetical protein